MATKFDDLPKGGDGGTDLGRVEDGTYHARVSQVIGLGRQVQTDWKTNQPKKDKYGNTIIKPAVWLTFELPTERVELEDGETMPRWVSKEYTLSMHEKANFRKLLNAIAPDANGLNELLNQPACITVGSTSSGKAKITGVSAPMKGVQVGEVESNTILYDFDEPDQEVFDNLPEFLQEKINKAVPEGVEDPLAEAS